MSADLDAFAEGGHIGIDHGSRLYFSRNKEGSDQAWELASRKIRERRDGLCEAIQFDQDERDAAAR